MRALTQLFLQNNSMRGSIPAQIGNLTGFTETDKTDNFIDDINTVCGVLGGGSSTRTSTGGLKYLLLDNNHFKHEIPSTICNLEHLEVFSAYRNQLSGTVPRCYFHTPAGPTSSFKSLQTLNLARNRLKGDVPFVLGCTKLKNLLLHHNFFSGGLQSLISLAARMYNGSVSLDGNISTITLHNNQLDQHLPKDIIKFNLYRFLQLLLLHRRHYCHLLSHCNFQLRLTVA